MTNNMDITKIREDYPILQRQIEGRPLIYLDNAATSQTPRPVVEAIDQMYYHYKANVHRGVHTLSQEATDLVELTREKVRAFINAGSIEEVIFTRGTTEGINLVASSFGQMLENGDEIIVTVISCPGNLSVSASVWPCVWCLSMIVAKWICRHMRICLPTIPVLSP